MKPDWEEQSTAIAHAMSPTLRAKATFRLIVRKGMDADRSWAIRGDSPPTWVGQSHICAIRLSDPSVSRRHLKLTPDDGALHVVDDQSLNGTFVNGVQIHDARLVGGEHVQLGDTTIEVERDADDATAVLPATSAFGHLHGVSTELRCLYPLFEKLAKSDVSLVIEGETGTGKEVLAESIHAMGPRASAPFVVLDCTAIAPTLLEATLFGHERGAFTDAHAASPGLLEQASGGTLFIDEIGDLEPALQPKLLRALERKEVRRLGATESRRFDVRIICATRRNLDDEVQLGRFRDDLYHRLSVATVELPPLRDRQSDVGYLARRFWEQLGGDLPGPPPQLLADWEEERWPGNVRELRNAIARAIALGQSRYKPRRTGAATAGVAETTLDQAVIAEGLPLAAARAIVVEDFERRYVAHVLEAHRGNVTQAAVAAGVSRRYLHLLKSRGA